MYIAKRWLAFGILLSSFSLAQGCGGDDGDEIPIETAQLRMIHASPDSPGLDIWLNDLLTVQDLTYSKSTGFSSVEAGLKKISIAPLGTMDFLLENEYRLEPNESYTIFALNLAANLEVLFKKEDRSISGQGKAKVRFLHGAPDVPAVNVKHGAALPLFSGINYKQLTSYADVDPGAFSCILSASSEDSAIMTFQPITIVEGDTMTIIAMGTLDDADEIPLGAMAFEDSGDGNVSIELTGSTP